MQLTELEETIAIVKAGVKTDKAYVIFLPITKASLVAVGELSTAGSMKA